MRLQWFLVCMDTIQWDHIPGRIKRSRTNIYQSRGTHNANFFCFNWTVPLLSCNAKSKTSYSQSPHCWNSIFVNVSTKRNRSVISYTYIWYCKVFFNITQPLWKKKQITFPKIKYAKSEKIYTFLIHFFGGGVGG